DSAATLTPPTLWATAAAAAAAVTVGAPTSPAPGKGITMLGRGSRARERSLSPLDRDRSLGLGPGVGRVGFSQPLLSSSPRTQDRGLDDLPATVPAATPLPGALDAKASPPGHASFAIKPVRGGNVSEDSQQTNRPSTG
ncbi:unnamed protein product, partial [Laminaria digitata]